MNLSPSDGLEGLQFSSKPDLSKALSGLLLGPAVLARYHSVAYDV